MSVYSSMYQSNIDNLTINDYAITPEQIKTNAGAFDNFMEIAINSAEETFKTNSIFAEQLNEAKYWEQNDEKINPLLSSPELKQEYATYKRMTHKQYTNLKTSLENGISAENTTPEDLEKIRAIQNIEALIETNNQAKILSRTNIQKQVQKDIEQIRLDRYINNKQQSNDFAEFVGDTIGFIGDPVNLATMFIPLSNAKKGANLLMNSLNVGAKTAILEMGIETANQLLAVSPYRKEYLGEDYTTLDAMGAIVSTGAGAFILGAGLKGIGDSFDIYFRKEGEQTPLQKIDEETTKQLTDNPASVDADMIDAQIQVRATNEKVAFAPEGLEDSYLKAYDKTLQDLAMGNKVDTSKFNEDLVKKEFFNILDDIKNNKNTKLAKQKIGKNLYDYFKKNNDNIRKDLEEMNYRDVFNKIDEDIVNQTRIKADVEGEQAFKRNENQLQKKANNSMVKDDNIEVEVVNDLSRQEVEFENKYINNEIDKNINSDIMEGVENYKKANAEQKAVEELHQCLLGGNDGKTN